MLVNEKTINSLINKNFELDCTDITLTQQVDADPIVYSGPGTIYQDKNGILNLKAYHTINNLDKELSFRFKQHTPGKIIGKENYFYLEAVDMSGVAWFSENIWISGHISLPTAGQVTKTTLREIKNQQERDTPTGSSLFVSIPGDCQIPCNQREELPHGGWRLNITKVSINDIDLELRKLDDSLRINALCKSESLDEEFEKKLLESLSIIFGKLIVPVVSVFSHGYHRVTSIRSFDTRRSNKALLSPIHHSQPFHLEPFKTFIERYISSIDKPYSELFGFWYKISQSWQVDIAHSSLAVSVSIEGIVKSYFEEYGLPDIEILKEAEEAELKIQSLGLRERIKNRLLSNIGQLKSSSVKAALYEMSLKGWLPTLFVDEWVKLRNKSAHADQLDLDQESRQKYLDQTLVCLTLFYNLLFLVIGYRGKYVAFSKDGWPEIEFRVTEES